MAALVKVSDFIEFPLKCFKVFGSVPYEFDGSESIKKKVLRVYHFAVMANLTVALTIMAIFVTKNIENLPQITENLALSGYTLMAVVKSISVLFKRKEFKELVETLSELFPKTKEEQNIFKVGKCLTSYKWIERRFTGAMFFAGTNYFVVCFVRLAATGVWYNKMPVETWFPFDAYDHKYYNFVFAWHFINSVFTLASLVGPDLLLYAFITLLTMQFDILCSQLEKINLNDDYKRITELIDLHVNLLKLAQKLQDIYAISILFNFVSSSILICFVGYQASNGISFELKVKFSIMLLVSALQVLMICYHGNKLTTAAENVAAAAYKSEWFGSNNRKMKVALLMMIQRSQKPTVLTAFKFSEVKLEVFTTVSSPKSKNSNGCNRSF
jgi:odorant receptor